MNELQLPFAVYRRLQDGAYELSDVYIHRARVGVRMSLPTKHEVVLDNNRLLRDMEACWVAVFLDNGRAFTLTPSSQRPVWVLERHVTRILDSSHRATTRARECHKNEVDCVVPVRSRLDCYCPRTGQLLSTTSLFSNYVTFPLRVVGNDLVRWTGLIAGHWTKCMRETVLKNKVFRVPPEVDLEVAKIEGIQEVQEIEELEAAHLRPPQTAHPKPKKTSLDCIIHQIHRDVQHSTSAKRQRLARLSG
jgi:hypothetical protein